MVGVLMKGRLHPNNKHIGRYNFKELVKVSPDLKDFLKPNPQGDETIEFSNRDAVISLNKALLNFYYGIESWDIPSGFLCPPIPGRVDYIHYVNDLIKNIDGDKKVLDIGVGANCIYPLLGVSIYRWNFKGVDIDPISLENAKRIVGSNKNIASKIELVLQGNKSNIFKGIINEDEYYHLTICNPPFHSSLNEAVQSNLRKVKNLNKSRENKIDNEMNFGGQKAELWCPGGEVFFIKKMINESILFKDQVLWFTTLVSKNDNVRPLKHIARKAGAKKVKIIEMSQGQKISRILAWSFSNGV